MSLNVVSGGVAKALSATVIVGVAGGATVYAVATHNNSPEENTDGPSSSKKVETGKKLTDKSVKKSEKKLPKKPVKMKVPKSNGSPSSSPKQYTGGAGDNYRQFNVSKPVDKKKTQVSDVYDIPDEKIPVSTPKDVRDGNELPSKEDAPVKDFVAQPSVVAPTPVEDSAPEAPEEKDPTAPVDYVLTPPVVDTPVPDVVEQPGDSNSENVQPPVVAPAPVEDDVTDAPPVVSPDGTIGDSVEDEDSGNDSPVEDVPDAPDDSPVDTPEQPGDDSVDPPVEDGTTPDDTAPSEDVRDTVREDLDKRLAKAIFDESTAKNDMSRAQKAVQERVREHNEAKRVWERAKQDRIDAEKALESVRAGNTSDAEQKVKDAENRVTDAEKREKDAKKAYGEAVKLRDEAIKDASAKKEAYEVAKKKFDADQKNTGKFSWDNLKKKDKERLMSFMLMERINEYRKQAGLPELPTNDTMLDDVAAWSKKQSHEGDIRHPYHGENYGKIRLGNENVLYNWETDPINAVNRGFDQWKNSPGHNSNMLSTNKSAHAVGVFFGNDGRVYMTYRQYYAPQFINNEYNVKDVYHVKTTRDIVNFDIRATVSYDGARLSTDKIFYKDLTKEKREAMDSSKFGGNVIVDSTAKDTAEKEWKDAEKKVDTQEKSVTEKKNAVDEAVRETSSAKEALSKEKENAKNIEENHAKAVKDAEDKVAEKKKVEEDALGKERSAENSVTDARKVEKSAQDNVSEKTKVREGVEEEIRKHEESKKAPVVNDEKPAEPQPEVSIEETENNSVVSDGETSVDEVETSVGTKSDVESEDAPVTDPALETTA